MPSRVREGDCPDCDETRTTRWIRGYVIGATSSATTQGRWTSYDLHGAICPVQCRAPEKCCTGCNVVKPADAFLWTAARERPRATVQACMSEYRSSRPEHYRNFELQRNYGITSEEYTRCTTTRMACAYLLPRKSRRQLMPVITVTQPARFVGYYVLIAIAPGYLQRHPDDWLQPRCICSGRLTPLWR